MTVFWDVEPCSLVDVYGRYIGAVFIVKAMMEAESTSETSVTFYQTTRRNIPEDSNFHACRRENLKSHIQIKGARNLDHNTIPSKVYVHFERKSKKIRVYPSACLSVRNIAQATRLIQK
jgi:hypothetical protein